MKNTHLSWALSLSLGLAINAGATQLNQQGADFQPCYGSDAPYIQRYPYGTYNSAASARCVIASIDHNPLPAGNTTGYGVYLDGWHSGTQSTPATIYGYSYNGTYLGSVNISTGSRSGAWSIYANVPANVGTQWVYLSILAYLPANYTGRILGVTILP